MNTIKLQTEDILGKGRIKGRIVKPHLEPHDPCTVCFLQEGEICPCSYDTITYKSENGVLSDKKHENNPIGPHSCVRYYQIWKHMIKVREEFTVI